MFQTTDFALFAPTPPATGLTNVVDQWKTWIGADAGIAETP
jgi:hypothetical protein